MGIPKAFRWLSERYPLISQLIQENRIPEFDNLYLDMNGIIHNCSHNNNEDVSFRISEEQIFLATFAYIEHLFSKIKPKKLFFMAIDGVAPRAKMNQQRSRRFRSAKELNDRIQEARRKGEDIPDDDEGTFQSNQITPGTPFMARLTANLRYFINKKISEDADWRGVEVVLSGHEVPGEGEHKIMEYIRLAKAQPGYNPNTRHCLYGLDADLIMLGLLSHDPHFCLLREEVLFGPQRARQKNKGLESTNFYLMHLSLLREYLDVEFADLKSLMPPDNPYDLERIIDDFILLAIFIGNDFLPHLPSLHINEGALNLLFDIYKRILPGAGGYLNEHGHLNVKRLQLVLNELATFEREKFEEENADSSWIRLKNASREADKATRKGLKGKLALTQTQRKLLAGVKTFILSNLEAPTLTAKLELPYISSKNDRTFLQKLADELRLDLAFDEFDENDEPIVVVRLSEDIVEAIREDMTDEDTASPTPAEADDEEEWEDVDGTDEDEDEVDEVSKAINDLQMKGSRAKPANAFDVPEWRQALDRTIQKYESAPNTKEVLKSKEEHEAEFKALVDSKLFEWKRSYYMDKLEFDITTEPEELKKLAFKYVEGLQWVLHYYYDGVASWSWFYPYHYCPKISDLVGVADLKFDFDLNKPFRPFEQLMGVLPDLSASLVPVPYRDLMTNPESPIKDFYPRDFEQDMNGKKQEWEAIVKIPFIDADRLVKAMATRESRLTEEERNRNTFGDSYTFVYDPTYIAIYPSSLPGFFPDLHNSHCRIKVFNLPTLGGLRLVKGLAEGALLGKHSLPGFPSLHTLPHTTSIDYHSVNVFQSDSRNQSVIVSIRDQHEGESVDQIASSFLGHSVYTNWPFLQESKVVAVSDEQMKYYLHEANGQMVALHHSHDQQDKWRKQAHRMQYGASKRYAVETHAIEVMIHVRQLKGLKRLDDGALVKDWDDKETEVGIQTVVTEVAHEDARYVERPAMPVSQEFPEHSKVFYLGEGSYGTPALVLGHTDDRIIVQIAFFTTDRNEPHIFAARAAARLQQKYYPSFVVCKQVKMSALTLSKITSGLMMEVKGGQKINVGLNLKFEARAQKVLGYAQRNEQGWEYSEKAIALIKEYRERFPEIINALDWKKGDITQASEFFPEDTAAKVEEIKEWIKEKGVRDFEKVSLYSDQMEKEEVQQIERLQDKLYASKKPEHFKQALLKNIPRRALLKPEHATLRLQNQRFGVGDRVMTVTETGSVPLAFKGVVVGIQAGFIDVVFDIAFMGGTTLGGRCSNYRGMSMTPTSILNLSDMQFIQSTKPQAPGIPKGHGPHNNGYVHGAGRSAQAASHPTYRGVAHRGHAPAPPHSARGRGGHVNILSRGGGMTGNFSAAAHGDKKAAYLAPASQHAILQSTLGMKPRQAQAQSQNYQLQTEHAGNGYEGVKPPPSAKQNYTAVAPPAVLTQPAPSGHRGGHAHHHHRGRGGRGRGDHRPFAATNGASARPASHDTPAAAPQGFVSATVRGRGAANLRGGRGARGARGRGAARAEGGVSASQA